MLESMVAREPARSCAAGSCAYRGGRPADAAAGRTVIVVDDGVATGVTDTAALRAIRRQRRAG